jgi:hypothetical protein
MPYNLTTNLNATTKASKINQLNFLSPGQFKLLIDWQKYPNAEYTLQTVVLPDMSISPAPLATPQRNIGLAADKVEYGQFEIAFIIDENLVNYKEIHDWILSQVVEEDSFANRKTRDLTLQIYSSSNNLIQEIQIVDAFPTMISTLPFDTTITDITYLTAMVTFQYSYFKLL